MSMVTDADDDQTLQGETLQRETLPHDRSPHGPRPAITLLMHPRIERIGDVHVIELLVQTTGEFGDSGANARPAAGEPRYDGRFVRDSCV